jgi:hypothetical protein
MTEADKAQIRTYVQLNEAVDAATGKSLLEDEAHRRKIATLGKEIEKQQLGTVTTAEAVAEVQRLTHAYDTSAAATNAHGIILAEWTNKATGTRLTTKEAADTMRNLGQAQDTTAETTRKALGEFEKSTKATADAGAAASGAAPQFKALGESVAMPNAPAVLQFWQSWKTEVSECSTNVSTLAGHAGTLLGNFEAIIRIAPNVVSAIRDIDAAAAEAAGDDGGTSGGGVPSYDVLSGQWK